MIMNLSGFIMLVGVLSYFQIRQILIKEDRKEALVYGFLMSLAFAIGLLLIAGVEIPSQNILINRIFMPIGKALLGE